MSNLPTKLAWFGPGWYAERIFLRPNFGVEAFISVIKVADQDETLEEAQRIAGVMGYSFVRFYDEKPHFAHIVEW